MDTRPRLFSKLSIIIFSVFGSTFFGALLYSSNLKATNSGRFIAPSIIFSLFYIFLVNKITVSLNVPIYYSFIPFIPAHLIGGLLLVGPFWKYQIGIIEHYEKRAIWGPACALLFPVAVFLFIIFYYQKPTPFHFRNKMSASEFGQATQTEVYKAIKNGKLVLQDSAANFYDLKVPLIKSSYFFATKVEDVNTLYDYVDYDNGRFMTLCMRIPLSDKDTFDLSLFGKEYTMTPSDRIISQFKSIICSNYTRKKNDTIYASGTIAMMQVGNVGYQYITQYTTLDKASADELSYSLIKNITKDSLDQSNHKFGAH
jgi:hypothetical protein